MSKFFFAIVASFLFIQSSIAQDVLTLNDGRTFKVNIIEVGKKDVSYRKFENPKGPIYRAEIKDIARIDYESGASDDFESNNSKSQSKYGNSSYRSYMQEVLGRNLITIDGLSLLFQNVSIGYEHVFGENSKLGLFVPVSINMGGTTDNAGFGTRNVFFSGIDAHYYPLGQGEFNFYVGPSIRVGTSRIYNQFYDPINFISISETLNSSYFSFLVKLGIQYNPVPELTMGTALGIGTRRYFHNIPNGNVAGSAAYLNFTLGYRF
jgi:hypothetical protein